MRILIISAHPDDIELAMGGVLSRLKREDNDIRVHVFSSSITIQGNERIKDEVTASIRGIYGLDLSLHDFPTMHFHEHYQAIRDRIYDLKRKFSPNMVLTKSPNALHPDHRIIGEAVESIFLDTTIYAMEGVRDFHNQHINKWWAFGEEDLNTKLRALECYKSQASRHYFDREMIKAMAVFRGGQVGIPFAEGFEVIREVW